MNPRLAIKPLFVSLCLAAFSLAQSGCVQPAVVTPPPIDKAAIEKEVIQADRDWATAAFKSDVEAIKRLEADDLIFTDWDGRVSGKAEDVRDTEAKTLSADSWDFSDWKVVVLDADNAVATGQISITRGKNASEKTGDLSGQY